MAKQRMSEKSLRRINRMTGNQYVAAWHRGGRGVWCIEGWYPSTNGLANMDVINRVTYDAYAAYRNGSAIPQLNG